MRRCLLLTAVFPFPTANPYLGLWSLLSEVEGYIALLASTAFKQLKHAMARAGFVLPVPTAHQQPVHLRFVREKRQLGAGTALIQLVQSKACGCRAVRRKCAIH